MTEKKLFADLHVHTTYSDGSLTPVEVIRYAKKMHLEAISITDHDTVSGIAAAIEEGNKCGIEVIPGVELSAELIDNANGEMHILGYYIDWHDTIFQESLNKFLKARKVRATKILNKLNDLGIKLNEQELLNVSGMGNIGRLHFAKLLVQYGFVKNIGGAFEKYLGFDKPAYVPKFRLKPEEAIKMILDVGGIPILAHPHYGSYSNGNTIKELMEFGLKGIEVWHSKHPSNVVQNFSSLADKLGIIATGGSDCHGQMANDTPLIGKIKVPYKVVTELKKLKTKIDKKREIK